MFWLPVLDARNWRLPFTSHATVGLANAWLALAPDERQSRFCAVLVDEPGLVIWTLASVAEFRAAAPRGGLVDLAQWWSDEGAGAMARALHLSRDSATNCDAERRWTVESNACPREVAEQFGELAVRAAARRKTHETGPSSNRPSDSTTIGAASDANSDGNSGANSNGMTAAEWWGTWLADWPQWCEHDGLPQASECDESVTCECVPPWLAESASSVQSESELFLPLGEAARLRGRWRDHSTAPVDLRALFAWMAGQTPSEAEYAARLQREKLASLRELAYGASHEINNPLATIATRAQALLRDERDPERQRSLAVIASQAFRAHDMIADMMFVAKPPVFQRKCADVGAMLSRLVGDWTDRAERQATRLVCVLPDETTLLADIDEDAIGMAVTALVANSLEALGSGGNVVVELTDGIAIIVRDDGPGLSPHARNHLFDPFFSGREAGRGLGFGLSKAWRIAADHGGALSVDSHEGRGATFTLSIPQTRLPVPGE